MREATAFQSSMDFSFDGPSSRRGRGQRDERTEFIQRAKAERERRAAERVLIRAATTV
jgi:hypothetical protein